MRHSLGRGQNARDRVLCFGRCCVVFALFRFISFNRFALAARHNLAGAGWLRRDDNAAIVLQRYKDQREQEFCLVQGVTSFLRDGAELLKMKVSSLVNGAFCKPIITLAVLTYTVYHQMEYNVCTSTAYTPY